MEIKFKNDRGLFKLNDEEIFVIETDQDIYTGQLVKMVRRKTGLSLMGHCGGEYSVKEYKIPCECVRTAEQVDIDDRIENIIRDKVDIAKLKESLQSDMRDNNADRRWSREALYGITETFSDYIRTPVSEPVPVVGEDGKPPKEKSFSNGKRTFTFDGKGIEFFLINNSDYFQSNLHSFVGEIVDEGENEDYIRVVGYYTEEQNTLKDVKIPKKDIVSAEKKLVSKPLKHIINFFVSTLIHLENLEKSHVQIQTNLKELKTKDKELDKQMRV